MKNFFHNLRLFIKVYPLAKVAVLKDRGKTYPGSVLNQIAYSECRKTLSGMGVKDSDITGAIVYIAVSLAYLNNQK
jgi:hypothetical protein